jgi:hypothetical protein
MTATLTGYARLMAIGLSPSINPCPRCKATRGNHCISKGGYQTSAVGFHATRKALVAGLSDDERVTAFEALQSERGHQFSAPAPVAGAR